MVVFNEEEYLAHYGILRKSGRYPWGSGDDQATRNKDFLDYVADLKSQGMSETEIARGYGISTTQLRAAKSIAKNEQRQAQIGMAQRLKDKGYSNVEIGKRMELNESTVRSLLAPGSKAKTDILQTTSSMLKKQVAEKTYVDIGTGVENHIGVSKERLSTAVAMLREEGYEVHSVKVEQVGTGLNTELKILAPPGTTQRDVFLNRSQIRQINEWSDDGGHSYVGFQTPLSVHPDRVSILYGPEGGAKADGVMYVRPGVKDISLGNSRYAQVRVAVGDGHYLKGMAMYNDSLPKGTDILFHTNKKDTGNKLDALKEMVEEGTNINPFGTTVRQLTEKDSKGKDHVTSAMNIVNEEADWARWSRSISAQVLSKQSPALAKTQLDMTYEKRKHDYDSIKALTNPTVKKKLLETFADGTDSASVHLKAAALPRQGWHAILPIESMSPTQIYAPNYRDGERVVLIRYPHGGTFEIPELTVNNRNAQARNLIGPAKSAVGIHHSVAERLSGADFDGDTVLVIPNNTGKIKTSPALEGLKDFNPVDSYPAYEGMKPITSSRKQQEMGKISNLITDMTIHGAPHSDLARAVRHSMVVIDAEKHNLNFKQSEIDNGIVQLKEKYQGSSKAGASTLISRAGSRVRVPIRKERSAAKGGPIDKQTGRLIFEDTGETYVNKKGERVPKLQSVKRLADVPDAFMLSSGTPMETLYATHSNKLKALANEARLVAINTPPLKYLPSAKKAYSKEVASLDSKLALARRNKPLERQAQILANTVIKAKKDSNPDIDPATLKKIKYQALEEARVRTGASKHRIDITQDEWDAIQAGAISDSKLSQILDNSNLNDVRELATPHTERLMTSSKTLRAKTMLASGYTRAEVADALGVSVTTLDSVTVE